MTFTTDNIIRQIKGLREWHWEHNRRADRATAMVRFKSRQAILADDAIAMLSVRQYEQFIFPYHLRLVNEFSDGVEPQ